MQEPADKKQPRTPPASIADEAMSSAWRRLLAAPQPSRAPAGVLGFFLEVTGSDSGAFAHVDIAPVWLNLAERGRFARPLPLDSRHLLQSPLQAHEQRLAATVLGLPQTPRKGRSYARLRGHVGDTVLAEVLDTAPCFLGGLGGLRLAPGKTRPLNWYWRMEVDGSQRLLPVQSPVPGKSPGRCARSCRRISACCGSTRSGIWTPNTRLSGRWKVRWRSRNGWNCRRCVMNMASA